MTIKDSREEPGDAVEQAGALGADGSRQELQGLGREGIGAEGTAWPMRRPWGGVPAAQIMAGTTGSLCPMRILFR